MITIKKLNSGYIAQKENQFFALADEDSLRLFLLQQITLSPTDFPVNTVFFYSLEIIINSTGAFSQPLNIEQ